MAKHLAGLFVLSGNSPVFVYEPVECRIDIVVIPVLRPFLLRQRGYCKFVAYIEYIVEYIVDERSIEKAIAPPLEFGSPIARQAYCIGTADGLTVVTVEQPDCLAGLHESLIMVSVCITVVYRVGTEPYLLEECIVGLRGAWKHHEYHKERTQDSLGQAEREAATLALAALYIERANREEGICLLVFFNYTLAVHETEATTLALCRKQFIVATNAGCIINLFGENTVYIRFRESDSAIADSDLNIIVTLQALYRDIATTWCKLCGIVDKGVYHEQCKCLVCLYDCIAIPYIESDTTRLEQLTALGYDIK